MRRVLHAAVALGVLVGPLAGLSSADPRCDLQRKLGIHSPFPCPPPWED